MDMTRIASDQTGVGCSPDAALRRPGSAGAALGLGRLLDLAGLPPPGD
jgi:hypothetical protein